MKMNILSLGMGLALLAGSLPVQAFSFKEAMVQGTKYTVQGAGKSLVMASKGLVLTSRGLYRGVHYAVQYHPYAVGLLASGAFLYHYSKPCRSFLLQLGYATSVLTMVSAYKIQEFLKNRLETENGSMGFLSKFSVLIPEALRSDDDTSSVSSDESYYERFEEAPAEEAPTFGSNFFTQVSEEEQEISSDSVEDECHICMRSLGRDHLPVTSCCSQQICRSCLDSIRQYNYGHLVCPYCRTQNCTVRMPSSGF